VTTSDAIGYAAASCTTLSFVPQVIRVWRTRSVEDISTAMYAVFTFGIALWLIYGLILGSLPIIVSNIATLLLAGSVLVMKRRYSRAVRESGPRR
jgi:MtN3 and saliva related transmembrane protein